MNDEWREQALRWLAFAIGDLEAARANPRERRRPRIVAFHAQQAAEKAMKAALLFSHIEPPRSHDLDALRDRLPDGWRVKKRRAGLDRLTEYAAEHRYPDDFRPVSPIQAATAARQAIAIVRDVREHFARRGVPTDDLEPQ